MRIGIIGLPQSGKRTLFHLLTGNGVRPAGLDPQKALPGVADIRDARFERLVRLYAPQSRAPAKIDLDLFPDLDARILADTKLLQDIARADALCLVVRAFENAAVYHVHGTVDPVRDIDEVGAELLLNDLAFVEKRLDRVERETRHTHQAGADREKALLARMKAHLEAGLPLRTLSLSVEEFRRLAVYPIATLKQLVVALNTAGATAGESDADPRLAARAGTHGLHLMHLAAGAEAEIQELDTDAERAEFMAAAGIREPALNLLSRLCMAALGLISFFTVGKDEVKQWLVRRGSTAPEAAGVIHSDIERGFIRAEVMHYDDLTALGSEQAVKRAGKHATMGRDYVVQDGDVINFLFNV
ncbi:MAG TPA: redox-regulated ATPase YchF [Planctomycetes bacterium]|nr:redox-regulated ATPase YchF [Planctomycetota bacterium]